MTQATMRLLFGGLLTVVALASLARGDDKPRAPELLPAPRCASCDKAADCCVAGAACCEENRDCCRKTTAPSGVCKVGAAIPGFEFNKRWSSSSNPVPLYRRVFPVEDLITLNWANLNGPTSPILFVAYQNASGTKNVQTPSSGEERLINLIQRGIEPGSWSSKGGAGTIEYYPLGKALVVNQTPDVQEQVQELLNALRRVQDHECAKEQGDCCSRFAGTTDSNGQTPGFNFTRVAAPSCTTASAPKVVQPTATPSIILIQQPHAELAEFAVWMFSNFAEWACNGFTDTDVAADSVILNAQGATVQQLSAPLLPLTPPQPPCVNGVPVGLFASYSGNAPTTCMPVRNNLGTHATGPSPLPSAQPTFHLPAPVANGTVTPLQWAQQAQQAQIAQQASEYYPAQYAPMPLPSSVQASAPVGCYTARPTAYTAVPPAPPSVSHTRNDRGWSVRANADGDHPSMSVRTDAASLECDKMTLKWRQESTLQFVAEKNFVRVRGKNFEAQAEAIECREQDGKLLFIGNATLRTFENGKEDCVLKAKKVTWDWDTKACTAEGAGSISKRHE